jgi:hypothetical protein
MGRGNRFGHDETLLFAIGWHDHIEVLGSPGTRR